MTLHHDILTQLPWPNGIGKRSSVGPLTGSRESLLLAELSKEIPLIVVIAATTATARTLESEIPFYAEDNLEVLVVPDWETLPYDHFSPHEDIISERLTALSRLPTLERGIVIIPMTTLMHRTPPQHYVASNVLTLTEGQALNTRQLVTNLSLSGYRAVDTVMEHGEYATRGSLIDLYPMGSDLPLRVDVFDEEIESMRSFDPESQHRRFL